MMAMTPRQTLAYQKQIVRVRAARAIDLFDAIRVGMHGDKDQASDFRRELEKRANAEPEPLIIKPGDNAALQAFLKKGL